jgi:uncharacterized protein (DUF849 family)
MSHAKTIITVSVTGASGDKTKHPVLPCTPQEIAASAVKAGAAGAAAAHIHVRNPETSAPSMEFALYEEVVKRIRGESDMMINLTTGAGARIVPDDSDPVGLGAGTTWASPERRAEHVVKLKPEICSLDVGSLSFGPRVFANARPHVERMAEMVKAAGVKAELEVFDLGHIEIARQLIDKGLVLDGAPFIQMCLGVPGGLPATSRNVLTMRDALPQGCLWAAFGLGKASFPMAAQSALLGGHVRVGFEDNFYLRRGEPAGSNADLVRKAVHILQALDKEIATADEAREILQVERV